MQVTLFLAKAVQCWLVCGAESDSRFGGPGWGVVRYAPNRVVGTAGCQGKENKYGHCRGQDSAISGRMVSTTGQTRRRRFNVVYAVRCGRVKMVEPLLHESARSAGPSLMTFPASDNGLSKRQDSRCCRTRQARQATKGPKEGSLVVVRLKSVARCAVVRCDGLGVARSLALPLVTVD